MKSKTSKIHPYSFIKDDKVIEPTYTNISYMEGQIHNLNLGIDFSNIYYTESINISDVLVEKNLIFPKLKIIRLGLTLTYSPLIIFQVNNLEYCQTIYSDRHLHLPKLKNCSNINCKSINGRDIFHSKIWNKPYFLVEHENNDIFKIMKPCVVNGDFNQGEISYMTNIGEEQFIESDKEKLKKSIDYYFHYKEKLESIKITDQKTIVEWKNIYRVLTGSHFSDILDDRLNPIEEYSFLDIAPLILNIGCNNTKKLCDFFNINLRYINYKIYIDISNHGDLI